MGCVTPKEEIDNTSNSKIDKFFLHIDYHLASLFRHIARIHFSISLTYKKGITIFNKFEKCRFFSSKSARKRGFLRDNIERIKKGTNFRSFPIYCVKISLLFRLVKCFQRRMFQIHPLNEHLLRRHSYISFLNEEHRQRIMLTPIRNRRIQQILNHLAYFTCVCGPIYYGLYIIFFTLFH